MISQPMNGKTHEEIEKQKNKAIKELKSQGYEVVNTLFDSEYYSEDLIKQRGYSNMGLYFLSQSLMEMSKCDAVYFCSGWEQARGCKIEHEVAKAYGLECLYEVRKRDNV